MADNDYGLLIASIVAIVAVVGLVILFSGQQTGAVPAYYKHDFAVRHCEGMSVGSGCTTQYSQPGVCVNSGPLAGNGRTMCGVDVACYCDFQ